MNLFRLRNNQCPKCPGKRNLGVNLEVRRAFCPACNYSISFDRMGEIIRGLEARDVKNLDMEMSPPEADKNYYNMEL